MLNNTIDGNVSAGARRQRDARQSPPAEKDWTVMIYMAGDNNLSADMAYALADLGGGVRHENLNLLVYYDSSARGAPTLYCDFTDADQPTYTASHLVKKRFGAGGAPNAEENSASAVALLNFVDWCVNDSEILTRTGGRVERATHPGRRAKNYALVLSGHSSGFQNMSLLIDKSSNVFMTVPDLRRALETITRADAPFANGVPLLRQKIGILGFDSCVMGMAELGCEFRRVASTLVASEGSIPSAGWTYGNILAKRAAGVGSGSANNGGSSGAAIDEKTMAANIVRDFIERQTDFLIGGVSVDLAAWDLSKIKRVVRAADALGAVLLDKLKCPSRKVRERLKRAIIYSHWECQSYMSEQNVDLKDFCQLLRKNIKALYADEQFFEEMETVLQACAIVCRAVDECVLAAGFSGGSYQFSNGIAIFFPWTELAYRASLENYRALKVLKKRRHSNKNAARLENWNRFLHDFTGSIALRKSRRPQTAAANNRDASLSADAYADDNRFHAPENSRNNPLLDNDRNNPLLDNDRNDPLLDNDRNNPLLDNDRNNPLPDNDRNNPLLDNDRNNPLLDNDRNNPLLDNDRNNPLLDNDRNNPLLDNDRGLQLFIMNQFKNSRTPWNIAGFTKKAATGQQNE